MDEAEFWSLIALLEGRADDEACHRLFLALRRREPEQIIAFQERLGEVLYRLDLRGLARQRWRDTGTPRWLPRLPGISADGFLYARCSAVASGRETVEGVLRQHRTFARAWDLGAERLLFVAQEAYEEAAGRTWPEEHVLMFDDETGSNPAGGWQREGQPPGNPQSSPFLLELAEHRRRGARPRARCRLVLRLTQAPSPSRTLAGREPAPPTVASIGSPTWIQRPQRAWPTSGTPSGRCWRWRNSWRGRS